MLQQAAAGTAKHSERGGGKVGIEYPISYPEPSMHRPHLGLLLEVAVQDRFRTSSDDQNAGFTGVCRSI